MKNDQLNEGYEGPEISLTEQRMIILMLVRYSPKQIAPILNLKESTVITYRKIFYEKHDLNSLYEFGHFVRDRGYRVNRLRTQVFLNDELIYTKPSSVNKAPAEVG